SSRSHCCCWPRRARRCWRTSSTDARTGAEECTSGVAGGTLDATNLGAAHGYVRVDDQTMWLPVDQRLQLEPLDLDALLPDLEQGHHLLAAVVEGVATFTGAHPCHLDTG